MLMVGSVLAGLSTGNLYFDDITFITISSLFLFAGLFLAGCISNKLYFTFLVFQIIAFPSAIDNLIPGVYQGDMNELNASIFPMFTHTDIYLLLGILKGIQAGNRAVLPSSRFLFLSVVVLFLSSTINIFYSRNPQDFLLLTAGFIHLRYLIWFFLLFSLYSPAPYSRAIINGLILSVIFLFIEAMVFTKINGLERLTSGTLGNNSYGNVVSCITVYLILLYKTNAYGNKTLLVITILIGFTTVILTETRMALFGGLVLYFVGIYYHNRKSFLRLLYVFLVSAGLVFSVLLMPTYRDNIPKRFDLVDLVSKIHFNMPWHGESVLEIESTKETWSFLTRFKLYETSVNMISKNPFFGIGSMRWDYYKNEYGFDERVLIDSHNGYLAILSQFGLISIVFIFFIYFLSVRFLKEKHERTDTNPYTYLGLISLGMAISDLSNAGIYKHEIYGLLCLVIMILLSNKARMQGI